MSEIVSNFNIWQSTPSGMTNGTVLIITLVIALIVVFLTIRTMSRGRR